MNQGSDSDSNDYIQHWLGLLGKLHNINIWIRVLIERYQSFVKAVGRVIPLDNDTRWNSWNIEIKVTLEKR